LRGTDQQIAAAERIIDEMQAAAGAH